MNNVYYTQIVSPIGPLLLAGDETGLQRVNFVNGRDHQAKPDPGWIEDPKPLREATRQLSAYFGGELENFDLPLTMQGTPFQLNVWKNLCDIPYGETISYGELACRVGNPKASRAVGLANG